VKTKKASDKLKTKKLPAVKILQIFAIEFVTFAIEFVLFAVESITFVVEFVGFTIEFDVFVIELGTSALEFIRNNIGSCRKHENKI